jgi:hypothetical protein
MVKSVSVVRIVNNDLYTRDRVSKTQVLQKIPSPPFSAHKKAFEGSPVPKYVLCAKRMDPRLKEGIASTQQCQKGLKTIYEA